jgi:large subunit ribosomal protein L4
VAKVFHYFNVKGKITTKLVKRVGDVAGSGKKPAPQKGRGMARIGNRRAPQRRKGGKAHGPVPRDLTEKINTKLRIKALQVMLSAKLYEDRIVLIESEKLEYLKTNYLDQILEPYNTDRLTFLTGFNPCHNFVLSSKNIKNVTLKNP